MHQFEKVILRTESIAQGQPTVIGLGTNRKRICDFLLVINSNLGPILPRFRDIAGFLLRTVTPPLFPRNFGVFPWTRLLMIGLWGAKTLH